MTLHPPRQPVRPSPVFLALLAATAVGGVLAWAPTATTATSSRIGVFLLVLGGWLVSLCLHEFGHAWAAWQFGDDEVEARGYLTLNPLKYSHPLLSLGLPLLFVALGGIGLPGAAVYLNTARMTPIQRTLVSLAGPFANLMLAVLLLGATRVWFDPEHLGFWSGLAFLGFLQLTAVVLNLLPIPGLDGYAALEPHLSPATRQAVEPVRKYGFLILLMLLIVPGLNRWFFSGVLWLFELSGVDPILVRIGSGLARFWSDQL